jgi:regulator of RNase E activity RraB
VFRRGGWRLNGRISAYLLDVDDGVNATTFLKYKLTEEEKKINIAVYVNHESLLMKISEGWKPEWESEDATPGEDAPPEGPLRLPTTNTVDPAPVCPAPQDEGTLETKVATDADALQELAQGSDPTRPRALRHYLYFRTKKAARQVAADLRKQGFEAEEQRSADGKNWLVLASHTVVITGELIAATRQSLEEVVQPFAGQYDGWEAAVE